MKPLGLLSYEAFIILFDVIAHHCSRLNVTGPARAPQTVYNYGSLQILHVGSLNQLSMIHHPASITSATTTFPCPAPSHVTRRKKRKQRCKSPLLVESCANIAGTKTNWKEAVANKECSLDPNACSDQTVPLSETENASKNDGQYQVSAGETFSQIQEAVSEMQLKRTINRLQIDLSRQKAHNRQKLRERDNELQGLRLEKERLDNEINEYQVSGLIRHYHFK